MCIADLSTCFAFSLPIQNYDVGCTGFDCALTLGTCCQLTSNGGESGCISNLGTGACTKTYANLNPLFMELSICNANTGLCESTVPTTTTTPLPITTTTTPPPITTTTTTATTTTTINPTTTTSP